MTFVTRIFTLLNNAAGLSAVTDKIFPLVRSRGSTLPALVYTVITDNPLDTLGNSGYSYDVFSISCDHVSYSAAQALADSVAAALDGYKFTTSAPFIFACRLDSRAEIADNAGEREGYVYRVTLDFKIISKG